MGSPHTTPELKFRAGAETTAGKLAATTTSGAGSAKEQFKVFDPGGGLYLGLGVFGVLRVMAAFSLRL